MQYKFVEVYFSSMRVSYFFRFWKAIVWSWKSLKRFVAMFTFFDILIEVKYLQASLPFPTLSLNFWRFGGTGRFGRVSRYFLLFFYKICCFLRQQVYDQPVCTFSKTPPFSRALFQSHQNTLQEHLDYAKVTLICLTSLHEFLFLGGAGGYFIGISLKPSDVYFIFLKCGSSVTSIW